MSYRSLVKLFHMDRSNDRYERCATLARQRLAAESTFRTGIQANNNELFLAVPRELTLLTDDVVRGERAVCDSLRALPPVARGALVRDLVTREVVCTNELEGIHSTRRQILMQLETPREDSTGERRFRELARLYLDLSREGVTLPRTPDDIRRIYDCVMSGEPLSEAELPDGRLFRRNKVEIIGDGLEVVHEGLHPEERIIDCMQRMLSLIHTGAMPEMFAAIASHFVFEFAHPFYDGNGRTGRYLLALFLRPTLSVPTTLTLSRAMAENHGSYYRSFREAENPLNYGELTPFVLNILGYIRNAQDDLIEDMGEKSARLAAAETRLGTLADELDLTEPQARVLSSLAQTALFGAFPDVSLSDLASFAGLGTQQARRHAARLEELGLLEVRDRRPLRFTLDPRCVSMLDVERPE